MDVEATMAASAALVPVTVGEYLGSVYRPDVDYVDGVLEARNVGEFDHADLQKSVLLLLTAQEGAGGFRAMPELRVQVGPMRFRVPDVCVLRRNAARERVVRTAPMLCVEVLSPRDTLRGMRARCGDYLAMGVPVVWILDPATRTAYVLDSAGMRELREGVLRVGGTAVEVGVGEVFATLDA